ncbi:MAG TPA: dihydroorotase [Gammaproteobacteria bacterium]|nr:dihydroorotase [Gammaproteobacteria bacterium]
MNYHIVNAKIVNENQVIEGDLATEGDRIKGINVAPAPGAEVVDANGAFLMPGMIDDQVHFREPGFEHKGEIATESAAAVAGGITSYMEMPNCLPLTVTAETLNDKYARAADRSAANFGFYLGATNDNLEVIKSIDPLLPCGIKIFMGASTGNMLVDDATTLEGIFAATPLLVATHCEDTPMILAAEAAAKEKFGDAIPFTEHPNIRSVEACYASSSLAVSLAKKYGTKLHVLHLTTAKEMALFTAGPLENKQITAEACVHHLFFNDSCYPEKGSHIKCNPAIKSQTDQQTLLAAINSDLIDVIATDHAPHTLEEKARDYAKAPAGLPLVQHALLSLFDRVSDGTFSIAKVVQKTAHAPATLFQVSERGYLREGYFADLVLVAENEAKSGADDLPVLSKCGWSPFAGHTFSHQIEKTWVNGLLRYANGEVLAGPSGRALSYNR